ncbi:class I SAM-dependent methyltransferase [Marivibrio halodurans]|uniref:Class I SAM-dependent methyltransferase n=1 Tax=Marivibrio halodurans TaxID=2039722 RepID=A0A8J7V422_9PROT|nr:TylF/MycF/NovP-related O-methyltransferase [Marivibrio halodurans]MBP5858896.1 class I SAM-dependent methyltransferase [Marivibrio halodurans]
MVPRRRYVANIELCEQALARTPALSDGAYVECGTWRGGMSFGIATALPALSALYFFDSFQGLPPTTERDGERAREIEAGEGFWHDNNTASETEFRENIRRFGLEPRTRGIHQGWFSDTLPGFVPDRPIAILRMDGDWYDSTMTILDALYDHVAPGGLILIDDYYDWEGCSRAVHDFLAKRGLPDHIRQHPDCPVAYILKGF